MKLTITKANGTVLTKEFVGESIEAAKKNGWKEVGKAKPKPKSKKSND
tara:strand:+ start:425 stop:568 length:144 start_codon:yes stop_codon:yes gene_type:complete